MFDIIREKTLTHKSAAPNTTAPIIISAEQVLFSLFVCYLAGFLENFWMDYHKIWFVRNPYNFVAHPNKQKDSGILFHFLCSVSHRTHSMDDVNWFFFAGLCKNNPNKFNDMWRGWVRPFNVGADQ